MWNVQDLYTCWVDTADSNKKITIKKKSSEIRNNQSVWIFMMVCLHQRKWKNRYCKNDWIFLEIHPCQRKFLLWEFRIMKITLLGTLHFLFVNRFFRVSLKFEFNNYHLTIWFDSFSNYSKKTCNLSFLVALKNVTNQTN